MKKTLLIAIIGTLSIFWNNNIYAQEEITTYPAGQGEGYIDIGSAGDWAKEIGQTFYVESGYELESITIELSDHIGSTDAIQVRLYEYSGTESAPMGTLIATADSNLDGTTIADYSAHDDYIFTFTDTTLTNDTYYFIRINRTGELNNNQRYKTWHESDSYANGKAFTLMTNWSHNDYWGGGNDILFTITSVDISPQCSDETDNDEDEMIDYPEDPGCTDAEDNDETDPPPAEITEVYPVHTYIFYMLNIFLLSAILAVKIYGRGNNH